MKSRTSQCLALAAFSIGLCTSAAGWAEEPVSTDTELRAGALFKEARQLAQSGDYQKACPKFEQSLRLKVGIGVQFNLADCWERIGRTASAHALFQGAAATARATGQVDRERVAQARAVALEPRLVRLLIEVRGTDKGLVVRRNQIIVEHASWGSAEPVDAGSYVIEATAPGKSPWSTSVTVPVSATEPVSIVVPPLSDAAGACAPASTPVLSAAKLPPRRTSVTVAEVTPPVSPPPESAPRSKRRATYTVALASLGVASVGLGTFFALESRSKNNSAKAICPTGNGCTRAQIYNHGAYLDDAKAFRTWSFVGFGVGASALIGATVLYLAPSTASGRAGFSAAPYLFADGSFGATASGRF